MPKLRTRLAGRAVASWSPHRALLLGLPGGQVNDAADRRFYQAHRERLNAPPWSYPGRPHGGYWRFESGVPAELRDRDGLDLLDGGLVVMAQLEADRQAWLSSHGWGEEE